MKKDELKKAFDKKFGNIEVSKELKDKTLEKIAHTKTSHLPYLKNFAAIFIVTFLCLSIYLARDTQKADLIYDTSEQKELNNSTEFYRMTTPQDASYQTNDVILKQSANSYGTSLQSAEAVLDYSKASQELTESVNLATSTISEEEFLIQHPNSEKTKNGYILHENDKEIIYVFKDKVLDNIITIE